MDNDELKEYEGQDGKAFCCCCGVDLHTTTSAMVKMKMNVPGIDLDEAAVIVCAKCADDHNHVFTKAIVEAMINVRVARSAYDGYTFTPDDYNNGTGKWKQ